MTNRTLASVAGVALFIAVQPAAQATIFKFGTGGQFTPVGTLASLNTEYNDATNAFEFDFRIADNESSGTPVVNDSFWLTVTNGPLPTISSGGTETVIFYGDANDPVNPRLTAYVYNDALDQNSYTDASGFIGNFDANFSFAREVVPIFSVPKDVSHFNITLDATAINNLFPGNPNWNGIQFGPEIGIWLRMFDGEFTYNGNEIDTLTVSPDGRGFFDRDFQATTVVVPEPAAVSLLGLGVAGLLGARRRRSARQA